MGLLLTLQRDLSGRSLGLPETMREIGAVITPLEARHHRKDLVNRPRSER
jgi:hypothetical protein